MKHFIRLVRPVNLLIIAVTMYSTRLFLYLYQQVFGIEIVRKHGESFDFFLLVFSTVIIAAAGNIINDYFDVRADRINKPEKLIVTKYINRKFAILSHWILNFIAFGIAVYLSARNDTFWYVFIHLLSINTLWFYSMNFKRKPLIGNFMIAGLTALVPILCGVHFYIQNEFPPIDPSLINSSFTYWLHLLLVNGHFIYILAFFAFSANFSREIIKDIEDMKGDKALRAKTLPIVAGVKGAKRMAGLLLILSPLFFIMLYAFKNTGALGSPVMDFILFLPVLIAFTLDIITLWLLSKAVTRKQLKYCGLLIKTSMSMGVILPFYWLLFV